MKFDLGFGNSVCVRQAFIQYSAPIHIGDMALNEFDYPPYEGDPALVELTKEVIARQTGHSYKHIILTNGATGGVVIGLRMYALMGAKYCVTRKPPYYLRYPTMIEASGLKQHPEGWGPYQLGESVTLVDIPSNPLSKFTPVQGHLFAPVVLDGVYYNRVYMSLVRRVELKHDLMVGSYSKLLGINGIRIGWIATNDDSLAERLHCLAKAEYCGLSVASTTVLLQSLRGFDWDAFELSAKLKLDSNRTEWQKLERLFGYSMVMPDGMFYYGIVDYHCRKLLEKSGIHWTPGSALGTDDSYGRFNLGQDCDLIKQAVKTILVNDTI